MLESYLTRCNSVKETLEGTSYYWLTNSENFYIA